MSVNPMMLIQLKSSWDRFTKNHPKFSRFWKAAYRQCLAEGTVVEFKVTAPDGTELSSNLKLSSDDLELIRQLEEIRSQ